MRPATYSLADLCKNLDQHTTVVRLPFADNIKRLALTNLLLAALTNTQTPSGELVSSPNYDGVSFCAEYQSCS